MAISIFRCANVNFSRRNQCNRCGKGKLECTEHRTLSQPWARLFDKVEIFEKLGSDAPENIYIVLVNIV